MKTDEMNLTVDELEELCRLYMDCKLSVMEEKELEYVLTHTDLTSPAIAEVRSLIGIQIIKTNSSKPIIKKKFPNWWLTSGIAACFAILLVIGITFFNANHPKSQISDNCIAYVNGQEIRGEVAMARIESETQKAEAFISRMAEFDEAEQSKIEQFMNHQNDI